MIAFLLIMILPLPALLQGGSDGFLGYPWGTPLVDMQDRFALDSDASASRRVALPCNVAWLGGAELESCEMEFSGNRFAGAIITTKGSANSQMLLAYLVQLYGPRPREEVVAYQWLFGDTHISYDIDSTGDGYAYWYSLSLQEIPDSAEAR